jgi:origin recognition complex subunit 5
VLYGLHATGKTAITRAVLDKLCSPTSQDGPNSDDELRYALIKSVECISGRHLVEQTIGAVAKATNWSGELSACPNVAHLVVEVGKMMSRWTESNVETSSQRLVLVFDCIDHQREIPATLLPAFARMCEIVSPVPIESQGQY